MKQKNLKFFLIHFSRPLVLILLFCFFSIYTGTFWSLSNWSNVANIILQQAPFSILLASCMTISIILRSIDLSMGASVALISCVCGIILRATASSMLAIVAALILGCLIGLVNGTLIAKVKVPPFVATYSMRWLLNGIALILLGGRQIYDLGSTFRNLFISNRWTFFYIMVVVTIILGFVMSNTVLGHLAYATGSNPVAARVSGIRTDAVTIVTFVISGCVIGLISVMYLANLGTAEPNIGGNFAINAVAATLVGGTTIGGGNGKISNAVIGALIMLCLTNGMIHCGVPSVWQQFVVGSVIIFSIVTERLMHKIASKFK